MPRKVLTVTACVALFSGFGASAEASTKHKISDTVQGRVLTSSSKVVVYTGTTKDKHFGDGAIISRSMPTSTSGKFSEVMIAYYKAGTITFKGYEVVKGNPDGTTSFDGPIKAVGGTGAYKGMKGSLRLTGTAPASDPTYATFKATGSLTF